MVKLITQRKKKKRKKNKLHKAIFVYCLLTKAEHKGTAS